MDTAPRPKNRGAAPAGTQPVGAAASKHLRQLRDASAAFQVAEGRMTAAALAGSGW